MKKIFLLLAFLILENVSPIQFPFSSHSNQRKTRNENKCGEKYVKPNIIIILVDDLGWNDVSFHGSNQIPTPNIDALAYNGVILNNHYVTPLCTPSRSSLLTGKYPIHTGMQHLVLTESEPRGLPLSEKLLPEHLKEIGYKTHAIGKWHLGYYHQEYTPTFRGFDSHFGFWNGLQDYYSHIVESAKEGYIGFDMRRNMSVAWDTAGKYSTDLFTEEAIRLIDEHDKRNPMFMYLAHLAPHTGKFKGPLQAPEEEIAKFSHIKDPERKIYAAMVSKVDQSVGKIISALKNRKMLKNSIIIFMTDNGASTHGMVSNRGSNYPLRGLKATPWEAAVRVVAAIWSPLIENPKRVSSHLMHITDWLPTLYSAAGADPKKLGTIDGVNLWSTLVSEKKNPRSEVLINIDEIWNYAAIRQGDFKYVIGSTNIGELWYGDTGRPDQQEAEGISPEYKIQDVLMSKAEIAFSGLITDQQKDEILNWKLNADILTLEDITKLRIDTQLKYNLTKTLKSETPIANQQMFALKRSKIPKSNKKIEKLTLTDIQSLRRNAELKCNVKKEYEIACNPVESPCLFNIKEDPCEKVNLARTRPEILKVLEEALQKHRETVIPASNVENDLNANPANWNGIWVNWKDPLPNSI